MRWSALFGAFAPSVDFRIVVVDVPLIDNVSPSTLQLMLSKLDSPEVARRVMVGTHTDDISQHVRPVVWRTKRLDMVSFCIPRTVSQGERAAAKLALVVVQCLHAVRESRVAEDTRSCCLDPFRDE